MNRGSQNNGSPTAHRSWLLQAAADLEQSDRWRLMGQS